MNPEELAEDSDVMPTLLPDTEGIACSHGIPGCHSLVAALVHENLERAGQGRSVQQLEIAAFLDLSRDDLSWTQMCTLVHSKKWRQARWFLAGWLCARTAK